MTPLEEMKIILREKEIPVFTDVEIEYYLSKYSFEEAAYTLLIAKAENTALNVSGLSIGDSSTYFRMLARRYKPSNSRILEG